ncbi:hypothetical protein [Methylobacterium sp. A54F]
MAQDRRVPGWLARRGYSSGVARWIANANRAKQGRRLRDSRAEGGDERFEAVARELKEARR